MNSYPKRNGFTLIELMVVVVIIGLITTSVVLRTGGITHQARVKWSIDRIQSTDQLLREFSYRNNQLANLEFELGQGALKYYFNNDEKTGTTYQLSRGIKILGYLNRDKFLDQDSHETLNVSYSLQGTTTTYALQIGQTSQDSIWLLFSGLTGQVTQWEDRNAVESILKTI